MLEKIIKIIEKGKTVSVECLSVQLGISRKMTYVLLENLEISGYLKKTGKGCGSLCRSCRSMCGRKTASETGYWELPEKGK